MSFGPLDGLFSMDVVVISGRIDGSDIASLCARAGSVAKRTAEPFVYCDVGGVRQPDAACVDALAQLQLTVKRLGRELRLLRATQELRELIELVGLCDAVRCADSALEMLGEAEQREHPLGVQEEADPADPSR